MSYGKRISAVLLGLGLGLSSSSLAHATPTTPGTYTYSIGLGNGASFTLTQSSPLSDASGTTISQTAIGSPMDGYFGGLGYSTTLDSTGFTVLQFEYAKPTSPGSNTASSILSYTFAEDNSFWALTDPTSFPADGVTTYDGLLYVNLNLDGSFVHPDDNSDFVHGTVNQGAWFNTYTPGDTTPDPQCTQCTIHVTFTPSSVSAVPEPSTMALLSTGMTTIFGVYRRRRRS